MSALTIITASLDDIRLLIREEIKMATTPPPKGFSPTSTPVQNFNSALRLLDLSTRSVNIIRQFELAEIAKLDLNKIKKARNCGKFSYNEIKPNLEHIKTMARAAIQTAGMP
jgi:DNA-directed RNA polymerase alpha subunit